MEETTFYIGIAVLLTALVPFIVFFVRYLSEPNPTRAQLDSPALPSFPERPPPGMGMIYILRPSRLAMAVKYGIRLDDRTAAGEIAKLGVRRYVAVPVTPGAHTLFAATLEKNDEMPFEIEEGQTLAFIARPGFGAVLQTARLVPMDERAARFHVGRLAAQKRNGRSIFVRPT